MDSNLHNLKNESLLHDILTIKNEFINNKILYKNFYDNNQKEIIETLILMGFNIEMIDMCFCFFTINTIEKAVHFMSKENEIWQHDYILSEGNLCIICNEYSDHKNFIIDKEKKLKKLKELNDSFNSKFRSSIEYLRESNANRRSIISNKSDLISFNEVKNTNIFEIGFNSNDKKINNANSGNNINNEFKLKNEFENLTNKENLIVSNNSNKEVFYEDDSFNDSYSIDQNVYIKPLNGERRKLMKFDIRDKIKVLDIGETQDKLVKYVEEDLFENANLLTEEILENKECNVCLMEIEKGNIIFSCKHLFCNDCWIAYIKDKIDCNEIRKIPCMEKNCNTNLSESNILKIINSIADSSIKQNYLAKLQKFKKENEILEDKNLKICPIANCGGHAALKNKKPGNILTCNNNHDFCLKCLNPAHPKKNCEAVLDDFFKKWRTGKIIKKCPNCKFWTEKNEGCNHMTCRGCQYQWCWLCSAKYNQLHYKIGFCCGLQFNNDSNIHSGCWRYKNFLSKGFFKQLIRIYLHFITLLFFGSLFIAYKKFNAGSFDYYFNKKTKVLLFLSLMIMSLVFQPLLSAFSFAYVILGIFFSIVLPCWSSKFVEFVECLLLKRD